MSFNELFGGLVLQVLGSVCIAAGLLFGIRGFAKKRRYLSKPAASIVLGLLMILLSGREYIGFGFLTPTPATYGADAHGASPPLSAIAKVLSQFSNFEKTANIARNPADIPPPLNRTKNQVVKFSIEVKEVISEIAPGVFYNYWTFDGQVPGPFLRVVEGDTVELTLKNNPKNFHHHSIDLHAVTGPGGGAVATHVAPGEQKTLRFTASHTGLFVYHCAMSDPAAHMAHGQYGMILVEPKGGLPPVDKEFYVMQGELYATGRLGDTGLQLFDGNAMLDGKPQYVVFNGKIGGASMDANVEDKVRMYVGNGGVALNSSFHVIGEIFDTVYPEASISSNSALLHSVQTTNIPAGGATVVEFGLQVPGKFMLVDHALARADRGAMGVLSVGERKGKGEIHDAHGH